MGGHMNHSLLGDASYPHVDPNEDLRRLFKEGVIEPPWHIEAMYKGRRFTAEVRADCTVVFDGKMYATISGAAVAAKRAVVGSDVPEKAIRTNGWLFWRHIAADGSTRPIDELRKSGQQNNEGS